MAEKDSGFPYWLFVLTFPLLGGLYLGVVAMWVWAIGGDRPPDPLAVPVELFNDHVVEHVWDIIYKESPSIAFHIILFVVTWLLACAVLGVVAAGLLKLAALVVGPSVPRGE